MTVIEGRKRGDEGGLGEEMEGGRAARTLICSKISPADPKLAKKAMWQPWTRYSSAPNSPATPETRILVGPARGEDFVGSAHSRQQGPEDVKSSVKSDALSGSGRWKDCGLPSILQLHAQKCSGSRRETSSTRYYRERRSCNARQPAAEKYLSSTLLDQHTTSQHNVAARLTATFVPSFFIFTP